MEVERRLAVPFMSFDWATTWWRCFQEDNRAIKDRLFTRVIRGSDGELVAVAPMMMTHRPGFGPMRMRVVQFFGADPNVTELRGMLCQNGREADAFAALIDDLRCCGSEWDWVHFSSIPRGGEAEELLDSTGSMRWQGDISNFVLPLKSTWDEQRSVLRRNIKQSIRKCYNAPLRDGRELQFEVVSDREAIEPALGEFFRLHEERSRVRSVNPHPNVFESAPTRRFLVDVCQRLADNGAARVFQLRCGETVVATRVGFVDNDVLYLYYSGYDTAWGRYSVSTRVTVEAIRYAIDAGLAGVNLSTGVDVSKTRWGPHEHVTREGFMVSNDRRSRLAFAGYQQAMKLREDTAIGRFSHRAIARRSPPAITPFTD